MFKILKTLLAGILAAVIFIAIGASVYTALPRLAQTSSPRSHRLLPMEMGTAAMAVAELKLAQELAHLCWTFPLLT